MQAELGKVKMWDLPVRICHWSFVVLITFMWWSAENSEMGWHMRAGMLLLMLVTFRALWGFFGSSTARFTGFVRGPGAVIAYLRGIGAQRAPVIGHNPAGGWSVLALLAAMAFQIAMGLFAGDPFDGATGPLNDKVAIMTADAMTDLHESFFNALLALIALHVAAVLFYLLVKRDNLVRPMVTGSRPAPDTARAMEPVPVWRAIACAIASFAFAAWVWSGIPPL